MKFEDLSKEQKDYYASLRWDVKYLNEEPIDNIINWLLKHKANGVKTVSLSINESYGNIDEVELIADTQEFKNAKHLQSHYDGAYKITFPMSDEEYKDSMDAFMRPRF